MRTTALILREGVLDVTFPSASSVYHKCTDVGAAKLLLIRTWIKLLVKAYLLWLGGEAKAPEERHLLIMAVFRP